MPEPTTHEDQRQLREHLADRDVPCPGCGYNLRALTTERCPECNEPLVLGVRLADPHTWAFITAVSGLAAIAGATGALLAGAVFLSLWFGDWAPAEVWAIPLVCCAAGTIGFAALTPARGRAWLRSLSPPARTGLVIAIWGFGVVAFALYVVQLVRL